MSEPDTDAIFEVLDGRKSASVEQLQAWRAGMGHRLDELKRIASMDEADGMLADAYRARLREGCARGREQAELILMNLDRRIQAAETEG